MRYKQGTCGIDLLNCFINQYRLTIHAKKWCYFLFLNCINMIRVTAWQLHVIFQSDPRKDQLNFTRSVMIKLLRNAVRPETARALKRSANCKLKY